MSLRTVASFVITCDARRCGVTTRAHPTEHEAWCEWRADHEGMLFLAGMYAGQFDPQEYRCGKHWHTNDAGFHVRGAKEVRNDSKAA